MLSIVGEVGLSRPTTPGFEQIAFFWARKD